MGKIKVEDVTNYGRIKGFTVGGNYIIENGGVIGYWRDVFKVKVKNEEEVKLLTQKPIE